MMDNWRTKGNQDFGRSKSNYHKRKPPAAGMISGGNSDGQYNISSWEKRFVTSTISWKQFLEAKKYTHLDKKILNWDDSAGEEAFKTAKDAFCAKLHGIPYDVQSHDPDLYNNKIDWNSQEDNDLIRDFESEVVVQDIDNNHEPVVIFGDALPDPFKDYVPGWGDADDMVKGSWGVRDDMNKDGKIGCKNNDGWDWTDNKAGYQGWNRTDNKAGYQGWNGTDNNAGYQGWNGTDNKAGYQGWNNYVDGYNKYYPSYGYNNNDYYPSYGNNNNNYYPSYGNVNNERYAACNYIGNNSKRSCTWRNNGIRSMSSGQGYERQRAHWSTMQAHGGQAIHVHQSAHQMESAA